MSENKRFLEGCEDLGNGKYRIRENICAKVIPSKEKITEKLIVEGKEYSPTKCFTFLIWNSDFNGNGRSYAKILNRCIKEQRVTWTLADHPEDGKEADSLRICGIAKNPRMIGEWLAISWYPINWIGESLAKGYELGCPACLSSSCLGSLSDDGYVLDDDNFFVERWCDHLQVQPSNSLYQYTTDGHVDYLNDDYSFTKISETIKESMNSEKSISENLTIKEEDVNASESSEKAQNDKAEDEKTSVEGDKSMPESTMSDELAQQSMILNIKSMVKDADKMESPIDRKNALVSADCFAKKLADGSLHDEISKKIEDAENEIKELSAKGLQTDDLTEKVKSLEDENAKIKAELDELKAKKAEVDDKLKTLTDMYDEEQYKASESEIEKSEELEERNHRLSKEICSLKAKNRNLERLMSKKSHMLEARIKKADAEANVMADAETVLSLKKRIKKLENENEELSTKVEELEGNLESAKKANDAVDVELGAEEIVELKKKLAKMVRKNNRLHKALSEARLSRKESRFSQLCKSIEDESEGEEIVSDDIVNGGEIADDEIEVTDKGIEVERDEDEIMEKLLSCKRS